MGCSRRGGWLPDISERGICELPHASPNTIMQYPRNASPLSPTALYEAVPYVGYIRAQHPQSHTMPKTLVQPCLHRLGVYPTAQGLHKARLHNAHLAARQPGTAGLQHTGPTCTRHGKLYIHAAWLQAGDRSLAMLAMPHAAPKAVSTTVCASQWPPRVRMPAEHTECPSKHVSCTPAHIQHSPKQRTGATQAAPIPSTDTASHTHCTTP
jgi:hypothetical protein